MTRRNRSGGMLRPSFWPLVGAVVVMLILILVVILTWAGPAEAQDDDSVSPLEAAASASLGGTVNDDSGSPVSGVDIDLFTERRATYLRSSSTGATGTFTFTELEPGCYVVTFIAPASASFEDGSDFRNVDVCVADGEAVVGIDATVIDRIETATITADVRERFNGQLVGGVMVDLFTSDDDGNRIDYLHSGATLPDGSGFDFVGLAPGCYTLTFIAPDGAFFNSDRGPTPWSNLTACIEAGDVRTLLATIDGGVSTANLRVIVTDSESNAVAEVVIDLFTAGGDGSRGTYLQSGRTLPSGSIVFEVVPGCYVVVVIAPVGQLFPNGTPWAELPVCLEANEFETVVAALS